MLNLCHPAGRSSMERSPAPQGRRQHQGGSCAAVDRKGPLLPACKPAIDWGGAIRNIRGRDFRVAA